MRFRVSSCALGFRVFRELKSAGTNFYKRGRTRFRPHAVQGLGFMRFRVSSCALGFRVFRELKSAGTNFYKRGRTRFRPHAV